MRFRHLTWASSVVVCFSGTAFAQNGQPNNSNAPSGKIVIEKNTGGLEAVARARAAAGDCKSALDYFDAAMETSISPELHRDRGICHEKLDHPYPAIDDYRFYLVHRPNAPDADRVHDRLESLLAQTGQSPSDKSTEKTDKNASAQAKADASVSASDASSKGEGGVSLNVATNAADDPGANPNAGKSADAIDADEKLAAEADASSLRRGKGFALGPYFVMRDWTKAGLQAGEAVGAAFRYSFGAPSSLVAELGYSQINSSGSDSKLGGIALFGGYEARLRLDPRLTNSILFQGGLGYERLSQGGTGLVASIVLPRVRGGFRHVFGKAIGLELGVDAGYGFIHIVDTSANSESFMVGGEVALLIAF
ncbi:MAG: tetratricopeptide repeat protein [Polyangiaceae bacterium]